MNPDETFHHIGNNAVFWYSDVVVLLGPSCTKNGMKYDFHEVSCIIVHYISSDPQAAPGLCHLWCSIKGCAPSQIMYVLVAELSVE